MSGPRFAVAGNPNVGKTTLFNRLTGERYRVGNYPGVTVETRQGALIGTPDLGLIDLPGTYSLTPYSPDEAVACEVLADESEQGPDGVLVVVDAGNLARNLYFVLQVLEQGRPVVLALNMVDVARAAGTAVDAASLADALGVPVVETVARTGEGLDRLTRALAEGGRRSSVQPAEAFDDHAAEWSEIVKACGGDFVRAQRLVAARATEARDLFDESPAERGALDLLGEAACHSMTAARIVARHRDVDRLLASLAPASPTSHASEPSMGTEGPGASGASDERSTAAEPAPSMRRSRQIDRVLTHRVLGPLTFLGVMALVFQSIFSWAEPLMDLIDVGIGAVSGWIVAGLGPGALTDLLTEGVVAGVGNVVVFLPQIALLFLFLGLLEDSGYMARAAFIIDRIMAGVGLDGRSFVPLLSGYACAIPAILSTRVIRRVRDRLVTILMIPFMSCSARLPIYALVIGALFDANEPAFGPFTIGGLLLLSMYLLSTISALALGAVYRRTVAKGPRPPFVLELPPYRLPRLRSTLRVVWDRSMDFLRDAGTIILASTIVLWGLLSYPKPDAEDERSGATAIEVSIGGRLGKALEPALEPIGQDWRVGVGIIGSFAAREVLVSTLGLVYGIEGADDDDRGLRERMATAKAPDGTPRYTKLSGIALMVFFVYAAQCMSTLAVVRRETRSWRWPVFMFVSMTGIAYVAALLVVQVGRALGFA
jgi:ferrous iron transport protein B